MPAQRAGRIVPETAMDTLKRKRTLRLLSNGIYIVTSSSGERFGAATVTWLSQASFTPPLVMAAIRPGSNVYRCLAESGAAAVHVLDVSQKDMAQKFFAPTAVVGETINGEPFRAGLTRAPILENARAYFECRVRQMIALGDHAVVIMEVVEADFRCDCSPLTVAASPWAYGG
jgi:flavin reductase (DIM6/NTAB) family NADH-FMN oxidoreductase RutF